MRVKSSGEVARTKGGPMKQFEAGARAAGAQTN